MRKSLWIILALSPFAVIVVPNANADSITDATTVTDQGLNPGTTLPTLDPHTVTFTCCNGPRTATDLDMTFNAVTNSVELTMAPAADHCLPLTGSLPTPVQTCAKILAGQMLEFTIGPADAKLLSYCWSGVRGACISPTIEVPDTSRIDLIVGIGIGLVVMRMRIAQRSRRVIGN
jgi:hypothetical protein